MIRRKITLSAILSGLTALIVFVFYQAHHIYAGDSGDLVTAAVTFGVAHPPGYPLFSLLGWLLSRFPWFSPVFMVTFLSSVPHAVVIGMIVSIVMVVTKRLYAALFAAAALGGNYVFFLYSTTPEVFGLLDLSLLSLGVLAWAYYLTNRQRYYSLFFFVFGLAMTHHHLVLFLVPSVMWLWTRKRKFTSYLSIADTVRAVIFTTAGFSVYAYAVLAAHGTSPINWSNATTVQSFIRLVTRADYGTFQSGVVYGSRLVQRILHIRAYGELVLLDMTLVGVVLACIGFVWLWRKNRTLGQFVLINLIAFGPFFFFYASFPLANRFTLGTYERFLLPSFLFLYPLVGIGLWSLVESLPKLVPVFEKEASVFVQFFAVVVFTIYPVSLIGVQMWRFGGLPGDQTAENLARDILASAEYGSIVLLGRDTTLFTTQFVRYGLSVRPDITLLHGSRLETADYINVISKAHPHVALPAFTPGKSHVQALVEANYESFPVYSNVRLDVGDEWAWVEYGLLYKLIPAGELPGEEELIDANDRIWLQYHDPSAGILKRYNHLMLADVRDVYAGSRNEFGKVLYALGRDRKAQEYFEKSLQYGSDTQAETALTHLGLLALKRGDCQEALTYFDDARGSSIAPAKDLYLYEAMTYGECLNDAEAAEAPYETYLNLQSMEETPLQAR